MAGRPMTGVSAAGRCLAERPDVRWRFASTDLIGGALHDLVLLPVPLSGGELITDSYGDVLVLIGLDGHRKRRVVFRLVHASHSNSGARVAQTFEFTERP